MVIIISDVIKYFYFPFFHYLRGTGCCRIIKGASNLGVNKDSFLLFLCNMFISFEFLYNIHNYEYINYIYSN